MLLHITCLVCFQLQNYYIRVQPICAIENTSFFIEPPTGVYTIYNKERHEVMYSCPFVYWYRQTPSKERRLGEHISRLMVC